MARGRGERTPIRRDTRTGARASVTLSRAKAAYPTRIGVRINDMDDSQAPPGRLDARYRAFLETIAALRPKLQRYCARMTGSTFDGEDVVQDALFDAYRRLETSDDSRPIGPWLFRIAHNRSLGTAPP